MLTIWISVTSVIAVACSATLLVAANRFNKEVAEFDEICKSLEREVA